MARPSDREYKLQHKIKTLEEQCRNKDSEIAVLKKKIDKLERDNPEVKPKLKKKVMEISSCPDCGSGLKELDLPFGKLSICANACGYRLMRKE